MVTSLAGTATGVKSWEYRFWVATQAVSLVGTTMDSTALYWLAINVGHGKPVVLSGIVIAQFLPMLLLSRRASVWVAARSRVAVLIGTQASRSCVALLLAIPLLCGWISVWYLWMISFGFGCLQAIDLPARQMLMLDVVGERELRRGASLYASILGISKILGPALGGMVIAVSGVSLVFILNAASYVPVIAVLVALTKKVRPVDGAHEKSTVPKRGVWIRNLPAGVWPIVTAAFLIGGFGYQFEVTNPIMAHDVYRVGSTGFGLFGTMLALGGIAGNYYSSRRSDPKKSEYLLWAGLFGATESLAAMMHTVVGYDICLVVVGGATSLFTTSSLVFVQKSASGGLRALSLSAYNMAYTGFVPVGSLAVSALAVTLGVHWTEEAPALVIVCFTLTAAGISLTGRRRLRSVAAPEEIKEPHNA